MRVSKGVSEAGTRIMALTDAKIRNAKPGSKPIKLTDAGGLYLVVRPTGTKLWRYRYRIAGKENLFAVGEYPALSLAEARAKRAEARELVKRGIHPSHARGGVARERRTPGIPPLVPVPSRSMPEQGTL